MNIKNNLKNLNKWGNLILKVWFLDVEKYVYNSIGIVIYHKNAYGVLYTLQVMPSSKIF